MTYLQRGMAFMVRLQKRPVYLRCLAGTYLDMILQGTHARRDASRVDACETWYHYERAF